MFIETERTPNPATLKFLPGRPVSPSGTIGFTTAEDAAASPLAAALFGLGDVEGVFFGSDFISVEQIKDLLDTRIRPQVANDGGDIIYRGFHRGVVSLQMQGACSGCPSSTATLKGGIESLLKYYVPEVIEVRAV